MTDLIQTVRRAALRLAECEMDGDRVAVPTHFLYPSRGHVVVYVTPRTHGSYVVSDGGGATDNISSHGIVLGEADRFLAPFCVDAGLRARDGAIHTGPIGEEELSGAIVVVAETSARAALHAVLKHKPRRRRDLFAAVKDEVHLKFPAGRVRQHEHIAGASSRLYKFDFVIAAPGELTLLIDTVLPEANSINAKVAANIDVVRTDPGGIVQRIVYDDSEVWSSADLSFLQHAAPTIALSRLSRDLQSHVMH